MDDLDKKILALLVQNARATLKDLAAQVNLTSPAVAERIRRMEKKGIIEGYSVRINPLLAQQGMHALVSISVAPKERENFMVLLQEQRPVQRCFQVTGSYSHMVEVRCADIPDLEKLISRLQKMGQTYTQIILSSTENSTPVL